MTEALTSWRSPKALRCLAVALLIALADPAPALDAPPMSLDERLAMYTPVRLSADLSTLSDRERAVLDRLIRAAAIMDELFWRQACCERDTFLAEIDDDRARQFARINYGPWDRLNGHEPFLAGVGEKPSGARFYPEDMTAEEFEAAKLPNKEGLYSLVTRDDEGALALRPYHVAYRSELSQAAALLREAAALSDDQAFSRYLRARAAAFLTGEYQASDLAWMDMKTNRIDVVIGPIETYEDQRYGYRAAFEGYVLLKDMAWSARLARYAKFLPMLQEGLPVAAAYRAETPGSDAELNAYDVLYYAGDCNAGSKTIAINLPNDEQVQLAKGTRRLQLKNAMRAKFDKILVPISEQLIAADQRAHITFDAFFANTMFHEVAHGLGIKNTIDGKGTVRQALLETSSAIEEGKADILGLYMITRLHEMDELPDSELMDNYVTFLASIFRSVRFGAASAHGRANMIRFNFFEEAGAFSRDERTGTYRIDMQHMQLAMTALSRKLLTLQGDGDLAGARQLIANYGVIGSMLQSDLDRLADAGIAVDIVFEQGADVLGLGEPAAPRAPAISGDAR